MRFAILGSAAAPTHDGGVGRNELFQSLGAPDFVTASGGWALEINLTHNSVARASGVKQE